MWRGYITDWGQTVEQDRKYVTTITAKDAFVRLEQIKLPSSAWAMEIVKDDPTLWFRLNETGTVRITDSSDGGNYGLYDNCVQGAQGLVVNDADSAAQFAHSLEERAVIQNPSLISGYPFTASLMFQIDSSDPDGVKEMFSSLPHPPAISPGVDIRMLSTPYAGRLYALVDDGTNGRACWSIGALDDSHPHHVAWVATSASSMSMYVDGVFQGIIATGGSGAPTWPGNPSNGYTIGNYTDLLVGDYGFGANAAGDATQVHRGTIDEVCVWDGQSITAARIAAHSLAVLTGWSGDDSGARVTRFLDVLGWAATLRAISSGISILGPASWLAGSTALAAMQAWADTELGAFFIGKSGEITWRSRHYPLVNANAMTSQATFGDKTSGLALGYNAIELPRDEALIRNPVTASRVNGVSVTVKDDPGIEKYGDRAYAMVATQDQLDSAVRDRALWGLNRWKELGTRLASMTLTPTSDPSLWPQALGRELGDRITVKRTPLGTGNQVSLDLIIERIEHTFTPFTWTTKFSGSPVDPNVGKYLILDDPTFGLLDTALMAY